MNVRQIGNLTQYYEIGLSDIWEADSLFSPC